MYWRMITGQYPKQTTTRLYICNQQKKKYAQSAFRTCLQKSNLLCREIEISFYQLVHLICTLQRILFITKRVFRSVYVFFIFFWKVKTNRSIFIQFNAPSFTPRIVLCSLFLQLTVTKFITMATIVCPIFYWFVRSRGFSRHVEANFSLFTSCLTFVLMGLQ